MLQLLQRWFIGHSHKYKIIRQGTIVDDSGIPVGKWYDLQCVECGKIKRKNNTA